MRRWILLSTRCLEHAVRIIELDGTTTLVTFFSERTEH